MTMATETWSTKEIILLIDMYKDTEILWNTGSKEYFNKMKRKVEMTRIGEELSKPGECLTLCISNNNWWKNLQFQATFFREHSSYGSISVYMVDSE